MSEELTGIGMRWGSHTLSAAFSTNVFSFGFELYSGLIAIRFGPLFFSYGWDAV